MKIIGDKIVISGKLTMLDMVKFEFYPTNCNEIEREVFAHHFAGVEEDWTMQEATATVASNEDGTMYLWQFTYKRIINVLEMHRSP